MAVLDFDDSYVGNAGADISGLLMHSSIDHVGLLDLDRLSTALSAITGYSGSFSDALVAVGLSAFKYLIYVMYTDIARVGHVRSEHVRNKYARVVREVRQYLDNQPYR